MVNKTEILSDNGIIPEEEFSHTILIIKYRKKKNSTLTNLLGFHIVPLKKKRKIIKI